MTSSPAAPKYPSALSSALGYEAYYGALPDRIQVALLPALSPYFARARRVLELCSGNGTHAVVYSKVFPSLDVTPTEADQFGVREIGATVEAAAKQFHPGSGGVREGVVLDFAEESGWKVLEQNVGADGQFELVVGSNFLQSVAWFIAHPLAHVLTPTSAPLPHGTA